MAISHVPSRTKDLQIIWQPIGNSTYMHQPCAWPAINVKHFMANAENKIATTKE